jgi:hypothetical protein
VNKTPRKSPSIKLVAIAEDEATLGFNAVIKFRDIDGQIRRIEQPRSTLRNIEKLKETLDDAGAYLSTDDRKNYDAIRALSSSVNHAERWKYVPHVGWYDDHRAFVLPVASLADLAATP